MSPDTDTDIAIVGGGPVGAALALALNGSGLRVTVLEARHGNAHDAEAVRSAARPIAVSHGSRLLLERLGVWQALTHVAPSTPIRHIHVSQRGGFGRVAISATDVQVPALGYVFDYHQIFSALALAAQQAPDAARGRYCQGARVTALQRDGARQRLDYTEDGAAASMTSRWVVVADGGDIAGLAPLKTIAYAQYALTARVRTAVPHQHVAYERFTASGPLALLPYDLEMALVWTLPPARAMEMLNTDDKSFLATLGEAFGTRLGEFTAVTQRACYPLALRYRAATWAPEPGVITIGNAAQTLHPVAGQGFNLGLRDAWELSRWLRSEPHAAQRPYQTSRRFDRAATVAATHGLVRLFSNDFFPLHALRGAGMTLLGSVPPARDFLARRMIFGVRG